MAANYPFTMSGVREVLDSMPEPPPGIEFLVGKTEQAVSEESADAFDYSKALVEGTCKTILGDRGIEAGNWEGIKLFRETNKQLDYVPTGHLQPKRFQEGITNVLYGLEQSVKGLYELRNLDGLVSHGKDGYQQLFFSYHLQLAARAADAIIHFLMSAHRKRPADSVASRLRFDDYPKFNDYVDENHETQIFGQTLRPSLVLYSYDNEHVAYKEMLIEWQNTIESDETSS